MTVIYNQSTVNARLQQVLNAISTGSIQMLDGSNNILVSIPNTLLSVSSGVLLFGTASVAIARSGRAVAAQITGAAGVVISGLTVSSSPGTDIVMQNANMIAGQGITLTSGSITGR